MSRNRCAPAQMFISQSCGSPVSERKLAACRQSISASSQELPLLGEGPSCVNAAIRSLVSCSRDGLCELKSFTRVGLNRSQMALALAAKATYGSLDGPLLVTGGLV